jgi:hypothetical protein
MRISVIGLIYIVIGVIVAASQNYLDKLNTAGRVLTAILGVIAWPLLLIGFDISVHR